MNTIHFITRHEPTESQVKLAEALCYKIETHADVDAFDQDALHNLAGAVAEHRNDAFMVVHSFLASVVASNGGAIASFTNVRREDGQFEATSLSIIEGSNIVNTVTLEEIS